MQPNKQLKESDLYKPVRHYFESLGFHIRSEVNSCDLVAKKSDLIVITELKLTINIKLLIQATDRLSITPNVYIALPDYTLKNRNRKWTGVKRVIKMLGLGFILVHKRKSGSTAEVLFDPDQSYHPRKSKKRRTALLKEFHGRTAERNCGGSHKTKIMTAYREQAVHIAVCLDSLGPLSPKRLRELETGEKTTTILYNNHYAWFQRLSRGIYQLTPAGNKGLKLYCDTASYYRKRLENRG